MLRNGTSLCGYMPARVLDLVEVHRVTCYESRQCDGDPSQVPLASGCSLPAAKKLVCQCGRLTTCIWWFRALEENEVLDQRIPTVYCSPSSSNPAPGGDVWKVETF